LQYYPSRLWMHWLVGFGRSSPTPLRLMIQRKVPFEAILLATKACPEAWNDCTSNGLTVLEHFTQVYHPKYPGTDLHGWTQTMEVFRLVESLCPMALWVKDRKEMQFQGIVPLYFQDFLMTGKLHLDEEIWAFLVPLAKKACMRLISVEGEENRSYCTLWDLTHPYPNEHLFPPDPNLGVELLARSQGNFHHGYNITHGYQYHRAIVILRALCAPTQGQIEFTLKRTVRDWMYLDYDGNLLVQIACIQELPAIVIFHFAYQTPIGLHLHRNKGGDTALETAAFAGRHALGATAWGFFLQRPNLVTQESVLGALADGIDLAMLLTINLIAQQVNTSGDYATLDLTFKLLRQNVGLLSRNGTADAME